MFEGLQDKFTYKEDIQYLKYNKIRTKSFSHTEDKNKERLASLKAKKDEKKKEPKI